MVAGNLATESRHLDDPENARGRRKCEEKSGGSIGHSMGTVPSKYMNTYIYIYIIV
jgi:hypothetical protein